VNAAVDTLETLGVITVDRSGRANAVRMDSEMLVKADDPVTTIPQSEYHAPIRTILTGLEERIGDDIGVVLFGSVARGTADRTSEAHTIEQEIVDEQFDGDRYEAHIIVEPKESAGDHDRISDILAEGLTLRNSPALDAVKREGFKNGIE
jgi:hypothetical protein